MITPANAVLRAIRELAQRRWRLAAATAFTLAILLVLLVTLNAKVNASFLTIYQTQFEDSRASSAPAACLDGTWTTTSVTNAPVGRTSPTAVWTGNEMIVWGGRDQNGNSLNTGGRYNPTTDTWLPITTLNAPAARSGHSVVWTGTEMIIWGGDGGGLKFINTGARYNPVSDTWTTMTVVNAPTARFLHTTVWTGSQMIIWGGVDTGFTRLATGGKYDPNTDTWTAVNTTDSPVARSRHSAVWTGSEMIIWGGDQFVGIANNGARYNPTADAWSAIAATNPGRQGHRVVWTGSEMIVWGGTVNSGDGNTGARYNPATDSWVTVSTTNAPTNLSEPPAIWTGAEMIIWGGGPATGGRYNPATNSWLAICTENAPEPRSFHTAIWSGSQMITWGGQHSSNFTRLNTGGRYSLQQSPPPTPTPTPTPTPSPSPSATPTPTPAQAAPGLYGGTKAGQLFSINLTTGAGSLVGSLPGAGSTEIEADNDTQRGFSQYPDGTFTGQEFDLRTGASIANPVSNGGSFNGLEWVGSSLYGTMVTDPHGPSQLRILNPETGTSTLIGPTGIVNPIAGLAYDTTTMTMFGLTGGADGGSSNLVTLDLTTGSATVIGAVGFNGGSLEFGPDGNLYAGSVGGAGNLYRINKSTGAGTLVGATGFTNVTGLTLVASPPPCPTVLNVNSNGDAGDARRGNRACATAGGACTLRAAIQEANALPCGSIDINLNSVGSPIILGTALPDVNHNVNIIGSGPDTLTIQRSSAAGTPDFRIFTIGSGRSVTISGLTIANGRMTTGAPGTNSNDGAGINNAGILTMTNVNVFGNVSNPGRGGGIFSSSTLVLNNCYVGGTAAGQANSGGGIFSSTLTMTGGSIVGNSGGIGGGLTLGAGVLNGVAITDNTASAEGGGIEVMAAAVFINCLIANNSAVGKGGGVNNIGSLTVINSTISGNRSGGSGGALENFSGGIGAQLRNVTVTNNRSDFDNNGGERGGGININTGIVSLNNSIVAANFRGSATTTDDISGTLNSSSSFNLIGTGGSGGLVDRTNNNQVGVSNPGLSPLADNGGQTATHALLPASPAIDAGSNAFAVDHNGNVLTTDQRGPGFARIVNGTVDLGAFEAQGPLPTVQISALIFSTGEGDKQLALTVNRISGGAGAFTVDYATSDVGAQNCNQVNGKASSRCDYVRAAGTLRFAAGENSKTISILIVDDSYAEGPETFSLNLSHPVNAILGSQSTATLTINDNEAGNGPNPIDQAVFFVRQHYLDFLNREPDQSGWDFWTNQITSCGSDVQCNEVHRIDVSASFFLSIEFQQSGYLVERCYKVAYGDVTGTSNFPSNHQLSVPIVRFDEFLKDTQRIGQGVIVLQPGWEQTLEGNKQAYALEFVQTPRFNTAFATTMTPAQFVDQLNVNAGSVLSPIERTTAINLFAGAANSGNASARAQAVRMVAEDTDLYNAEYNRAFVLAQYFGYLRRNPNDAPDADYTGYDFWLTKLNQFNGSYINAEMVKAFLSSIEYRQRFGS